MLVQWFGHCLLRLCVRSCFQRSTQASGAGNGASNGRYQYVATVDEPSTGSHTYTDNVTVPSWHIVVPADASGAVTGCHSGESNPTAITLSSFRVRSQAGADWFGILLFGVMAMTIGLVLISREKRLA